MAHAILSASGAHRWMNCTPSARLEEHVPDTNSIYAQEGTLAHELGEMDLKVQLGLISREKYQSEFTRKIEHHMLYTTEMLEPVGKYVDYVLEQYTEAGIRSDDPLIFLEQRLDFSRWVPGGFGTGDCVIIGGGIMEVIDLKYGKGVAVEAEENTQMMLYALGALDNYGFIYDIDTVRMTVHQPRLDSVSTWELSVDKLLSWAETELEPKAKLAWAGEGEAVAGDWCRFCKVKSRCRARAEAMQAVPATFSYTPPDLLDASEIAAILSRLDQIQAWVKDVQEFALDQALNGVRFEGWKLVEGRSNRRYVDPEAVEKRLRAAKYRKKDIFKEPELLGITAMERLLSKKRFSELLNDLVDKPPGRPTLVPESDKRPELNSAAADFDL